MDILRPPGPKSRGLVGNFPLRSEDPLGLFTSWARQYGDIFYYRAFHRHVYFLNHPDLIEYVLLTNYRNFVKGEALNANRRIFGKGLLTSEGDEWLSQRRLMQPAFHHETIASYAGIIVEYAERTIANWKGGEVRDIHREMMQLTLHIVAKSLFNVEISGDSDRVARAMNVLVELGSGGRLLLPPLLRLIPTPSNLRYHAAVRDLDRIVSKIIQQRLMNGGGGADLLSRLLEVRHEDGARMTDRQLRDETMTLLLAGHETTALALSWTWYLLSQHPQVETKLREELNQVLNGGTPQTEDLARLPYLNRVLQESLRLYPPAWAVARNSVAEFEIAGYRIPGGASIAMSQWVMHRDPRYYHEPELFDPDRWLNLPDNFPKFAYFPFGGGPRTCIGASFATMEAKLILAVIAQRFQFRLVEGHPVEPLPTMTLRPKQGIRVVLTQRK